MSKISENEVQAYCREVERYCPRTSQERLAGELNAMITDFVEENPEASIGDVTAHFGSPEQFAANFAAGMNAEEQVKVARTRRWIWLGVAVAILAIAIASAITAYKVVERNSRELLPYHPEAVAVFGVLGTGAE